MHFLVLLSVCLLAASPALGMYSPSDSVIELTEANFERLVMSDDTIWIIEFYAPWCGHCQSLAPEYRKAAKVLQGIVKLGAINADEHKSLSGQYGIRGFPTIKIFGSNKYAPTDYTGQRSARGLADAALSEVKRKIESGFGDEGGSKKRNDDVIELTDENFDKLVLESKEPWLVEFFAPWCGHCKSLAPEWSKAASELKGKVKLGALDATVHQAKAAQYGVRGYPTIKYFPAGKKVSVEITEYDGGRKSEDIVAWALDKHVADLPPPELVEIYNEKTFDKACDNKPLCVVSVVPHILDCDAKCRNGYLKTLKEASEKFKGKMWGWGWAAGSSQLALEESLELGGFGYPAMAVVNFKKMKFSVLKGSFSTDGIHDFLRDISYGKGHTAPVKGAKKPKIVDSEPWDGQDGQLPKEEDIDLSDVDLDDEDDTIGATDPKEEL